MRGHQHRTGGFFPGRSRPSRGKLARAAAFAVALCGPAFLSRADDPAPVAAQLAPADDAALQSLLGAVAALEKNPEALKAARAALVQRLAARIAETEKLQSELADVTGQLEAARAALEKLETSSAARTRKLLDLVAQIAAESAPKPADPQKAEPTKPEPPAPEKPAAPPAEKPAAAPAEAPTPEQVEFFEKKIRPVLAETCFKCHGPQKQKGGLRLDSRATALKGGALGAAVVPGDIKSSVLIQALRGAGDLEMPPSGKLPEETILDFETWVAQGAPWPGEPVASAAPAEDPIQFAKEHHWAFKPVTNPAPPPVKNAAWAKTPIDQFLLARMEVEGIEPSPEADRRTLIRRAYFDLWGLTPTREEIAAFEADASPDAYEKLIDRLLDSPRYGERWARRWLDIARYADTKGYVFQEERRYPFSHTYRDYVIDAFNADKPYDRFIVEQIAADQLDLGEDKRPLAAQGFLTLGRRFLNNKNDIIDDRIDVVTRGLMGLTVACARCHDHKFDPLPTADYYSLHGVFASSVEPADLPLIAEPEPGPLLDEYNTKLADLQAEVDRYFRDRHHEFLNRYRKAAADYLLAAQDGFAAESEDAFQAMARDRGLSHHVVRRWQERLKKAAPPADNPPDKPGIPPDPVLGPWVKLAAIPAAEFEAKAPELIAAIAANKIEGAPVNAHVAKAFAEYAPAKADGAPITSMKDVAEVYRKLLGQADGMWADALLSHALRVAADGPESDPAPTKLADAAWEEIRLLNYAPDAPGNVPKSLVHTLMSLEEQAQLRNRNLAVDGHKATHPGRPPRAHTLADAPEPVKPHVFVRGAPGNKGPEVPRQFLAVLSPADRKPFEKGSGRLELAQAIAARDNPLTARVLVNRVWGWRFGKPLVSTPSDFGTRCDPPTHPELLDYLASQFMEEGWSVKKLHKLMMLSAAYRQTSVADAARAAKDPENRLVWRFNRRRLDFEAMRDSLLQVAGKLDLKMGGPSVEIAAPPYTPRRSVYGFIDRQNLPNLFRTFDLASPDSSSPGRFETTIPQQALFMLNSPFTIKLARELSDREDVKSAEGAGRVARLYEAIFGREPEETELAAAMAFVNDPVAQNSAPPIVWEYGYGAFDRETHALKSFEKLPHFSDGRWAGGEKMPENPLNWTSLTRRGGHPGASAEQAVVRRWIAPRAALVRITGSVKHTSDQGDGVAAHVLGSAGELGAWNVKTTEIDAHLDGVEVARGDTIDFVIDPIADNGFDSFEWAPKIEVVEEREPANQIAAGPGAWDAATDFGGPPPAPLDAWGELAQALMASNEFAFVD